MRKGFTRKPQPDEPAVRVKNYITPSGYQRLLDERKGDLVAVIKDGRLILGELRARRDAIHTLLLNLFLNMKDLGLKGLTAGVGVYNLLNSNAGLTYHQGFAFNAAGQTAWMNPSTLLMPRFMRFNVTFDF